MSDKKFLVWIKGPLCAEPVLVDDDGLELIKKHKEPVLKVHTLKPHDLTKTLTKLAVDYPASV